MSSSEAEDHPLRALVALLLEMKSRLDIIANGPTPMSEGSYGDMQSLSLELFSWLHLNDLSEAALAQALAAQPQPEPIEPSVTTLDDPSVPESLVPIPPTPGKRPTADFELAKSNIRRVIPHVEGSQLCGIWPDGSSIRAAHLLHLIQELFQTLEPRN